MDKERDRVLKGWAETGQTIADIAINGNCKGIATPVLKTLLNGFKKALNEVIFDYENGLSINKTAQMFGVSAQTIRNYIKMHGLKPPVSIQDQERAIVPKETIEALKKKFSS